MSVTPEIMPIFEPNRKNPYSAFTMRRVFCVGIIIAILLHAGFYAWGFLKRTQVVTTREDAEVIHVERLLLQPPPPPPEVKKLSKKWSGQRLFRILYKTLCQNLNPSQNRNRLWLQTLHPSSLLSNLLQSLSRPHRLLRHRQNLQRIP